MEFLSPAGLDADQRVLNWIISSILQPASDERSDRAIKEPTMSLMCVRITFSLGVGGFRNCYCNVEVEPDLIEEAIKGISSKH